jgi:cell division protein FtsZ
MPEVKPEIETIAKIKVVGIGGSGGSAINRMISSKIKGVDFIAINTDIQALHNNDSKTKLHIGQKITRGLGAGMNPAVGLAAAQENASELREMLKGSDMVFITCGLGGGTGTGASPVVAQIAKEMGALVVAVVTKPFIFEGKQRLQIANEGLEILRPNVDAIITVPNEKIWQVIDQKTSFLDAFREVDDILRQGIQGISEIITVPALINVDFADVEAIMKDAGSALMAIGEGSGENRATVAAKMAVSSPLLDLSIDGAKGILFVISGGTDLAMNEVNEIATIITNGVDEDAKIIFGANIDEGLKDKIKVTLVATGFESGSRRSVSNKEDSWTNRINDIFHEKPLDKDVDKEDKQLPNFSKSGFESVIKKGKNKETESEVLVKKNIFGFSKKDTSESEEDDFDVPPILRKGGEFKSQLEEEEEDDDFSDSDLGNKVKIIDYNDDEEEMELPSFIRKKMK